MHLFCCISWRVGCWGWCPARASASWLPGGVSALRAGMWKTLRTASASCKWTQMSFYRSQPHKGLFIIIPTSQAIRWIPLEQPSCQCHVNVADRGLQRRPWLLPNSWRICCASSVDSQGPTYTRRPPHWAKPPYPLNDLLPKGGSTLNPECQAGAARGPGVWGYCSFSQPPAWSERSHHSHTPQPHWARLEAFPGLWLEPAALPVSSAPLFFPFVSVSSQGAAPVWGCRCSASVFSLYWVGGPHQALSSLQCQSQ